MRTGSSKGSSGRMAALVVAIWAGGALAEEPGTWVSIQLAADGEPLSGAAAGEPGTRVSIQLDEESGALPDVEAMVRSLRALGGTLVVHAKRVASEGAASVDLDLWGDAAPAAELAKSLREAFPVLSAARIQVSSLDPSLRPQLMRPADLGAAGGARKLVIKRKLEPTR